MSKESLTYQTVLITGCAGFIGFHLTRRLVKQEMKVVGIDALSANGDDCLREDRLARLRRLERFTFHRVDIRRRNDMDPIFESVQPDAVCHLAARTGVRASEMCPREYLENNVIGTAEVLQASAETPSVKHMLFTSSSAVYGNNAALPMTERMRPQDITSVYGASKRSGEVLCETRASLDDLPITIARLFTVYGPWGRPNMAYHIFAHCLANDEPVPIFGDGTMSRDMTFIDDAVEALHRLLQDPPCRGTSASHRVVNVGTGRRIPINQLLAQLEELMGRRAERAYRDAPKVDVSHTLASPDRLEQATGFRPTTTVRDGLPRFVDWYRSYALDQSDA